MPNLAAGTYDVRVTTPSGTSSIVTADEFTVTNVTASAPAVTAIDLSTGSTAGGMTVNITGTNFSGATAVKFASTSATFVTNSDTWITATVPAGSAGTVDITVTTNNGTSTTSGADEFTYLSTGAPTVTGVSPSSGTTAGGASVAITGTNLSSASAVLFGGLPATSYTVNSSTSITAMAPPLTTGTWDITVTTPSGTSATSGSDHFTVTAASVPTVTSLGTTSGSTAGGTSVAITGTNFTGTQQVYFNGIPATSFTVNSSTSITAVDARPVRRRRGRHRANLRRHLGHQQQHAVHLHPRLGPDHQQHRHQQRQHRRRHHASPHRHQLQRRSPGVLRHRAGRQRYRELHRPPSP